MPRLLEQAVQSALRTPGVAVLTLPGDVGGLDAPRAPPRHFVVTGRHPAVPDPASLSDAARLIDERRTGHAAGRHRRPRTPAQEVLALAERLAAPMVLTLKAKEALERDNPYQVGQSGLIGNPAASTPSRAATCC